MPGRGSEVLRQGNGKEKVEGSLCSVAFLAHTTRRYNHVEWSEDQTALGHFGHN